VQFQVNWETRHRASGMYQISFYVVVFHGISQNGFSLGVLAY